MGRSLRFRVYRTRLNAQLRLAFAPAPPYGLTLPRTVTRRPIMQKVRGCAFPCGHSAPTACRRTVSGSISLPSPGIFSPFPRGTSSLSVDEEYLALGDGPPGFPPDFSCPAVLGYPLGPVINTYRAFTVYGRPFHAVRTSTSGPTSRAPQPLPTRVSRFGLFPFRSPLLGESHLLSFPPGTEMFQFPGLAAHQL
jgi:hypothetical protein